jgi:mono/diheme cytochrome c family protein
MMKLIPRFSFAAGVLFYAVGIFSVAAQPTSAVSSVPVYVPDTSHAGDPLPDGVIAWDSISKSTNAASDQDLAEFTFNFTNVTANPLTILNVQPGCHCTTADLPPTPWTIAAGKSGSFKAKVDLNVTGHSGILFKKLTVTTDRGMKDLLMRIEFLPAVVVAMTDQQKQAGIAAAKLDRQAVFKGDCVSCHAKNVEGKFGQQLFTEICAVCHEASPRATMVPDLHNLKDPTSEEFWRTWITAGKAGTLMPAFATSQGGPLTDMQIASLAAYLNAVIPSHAPPIQPTNAPLAPFNLQMHP